jgi:hypothetical protein
MDTRTDAVERGRVQSSCQGHTSFARGGPTVKKAFRYLNYAISLEVMIQAAMIAWAVFGESKYIDDGGVVNKDKIEGDDIPFDGVYGFIIHGINGATLIPLLGLVLLIVAFFAKIPGGVRLGAILFVLILVQAFVLPILAGGAPFVGMLHGANALAILGLSIYGGRLGADAEATTTPTAPTAA